VFRRNPNASGNGTRYERLCHYARAENSLIALANTAEPIAFLLFQCEGPRLPVVPCAHDKCQSLLYNSQRLLVIAVAAVSDVCGIGALQTPIFPERSEGSAPRGRSISVGYFTWQDGLLLLSITVITGTTSAGNADRCFGSLTDAYIRRSTHSRR
jgi:hypothetical protein